MTDKNMRDKSKWEKEKEKKRFILENKQQLIISTLTLGHGPVSISHATEAHGKANQLVE